MTEIAQDAVVEANRALLLSRSKVGINKYGVTLANSGLGRRELLQHALEETLDLANYIQAEIMRLDTDSSPEPVDVAGLRRVLWDLVSALPPGVPLNRQARAAKKRALELLSPPT